MGGEIKSYSKMTKAALEDATVNVCAYGIAVKFI